MDNANYHESNLLEAEIRPFQGRVQRLEDEPESLLQQTYEQTCEPLSHRYKPNEKLAVALQDAKSQIVALKEEIDKLCAPPIAMAPFARPMRMGPSM
jgi:predicted RNase H-like nuclease (RuvC/YqgF family)